MNLEFYKKQFSNLESSFKNVPSYKQKMESFKTFEVKGWPTSRDEDWRYAKLGKLKKESLKNYIYNLEKPSSLFKHGLEFPVSNLVFRNGIFDKQLSQVSRETINYIKFKDHGCFSPLPANSKLSNSTFYNLNISFNLETFYIDIPENTVVAEPIVFNFIYDQTESMMYHPQIDIIVGKNSQVKFIENHSNSSEAVSLVNPITKLRVQKNAKVKYVRVAKHSGEEFKHIGHFVSQQQSDSSIHFVSVNMGGEFSRLDTEFYHEGKGSHLEVDGLCFSRGKEQVNYLSRIFHEEGYNQSHQLYKCVLDDSSSSLFDGLIYIAPKSQKVDSSQMNRNLLLSKDAEVNTKPQLDINADDVKAAHGATVSELNDEEIFYLMSRGVDKKNATKIIERAFIDEVLLKVGDLNIQKWLRQLVK